MPELEPLGRRLRTRQSTNAANGTGAASSPYNEAQTTLEIDGQNGGQLSDEGEWYTNDTPRKMQTQTKRKRTKNTAKSPSKRQRKGQQKKQHREEEPLAEQEENILFDAIRDDQTAVEELASNWLDSYKNDQTQATREFINCLLKCAGSPLGIPSHDFEDTESLVETLAQLQEEIQTFKNMEWPLNSKDSKFKGLRRNLRSFIQDFIQICTRSDILYEEEYNVLEKLLIWITALSSSSVRSFRHTATIVALWMLSDLAKAAASNKKATSTTMKLRGSSNSAKRVTSGRQKQQEELDNKVEELTGQRSVLESAMSDIFDTVFVHRYRDVESRIRSECIKELGHWMTTYPDMYFDGQYLRYFGWMLSDSSSSTRLEVVHSLSSLYGSEEFVSGLRFFTERFKSRLIEMAIKDADTHVRVSTIALLISLYNAGYVEDEDEGTIAHLVFDTDPKVRTAAGRFLNRLAEEYVEKKMGQIKQDQSIEEWAKEHNMEIDSWMHFYGWTQTLLDDHQTGELESDGSEQEGELWQLFPTSHNKYVIAGSALRQLIDAEDMSFLMRYLLFDFSGLTEYKEIWEELSPSSAQEIILLDIVKGITDSCISSISNTKGKKRKTLNDTEEAHSKVIEVVAENIVDLLDRMTSNSRAFLSTLRIVSSLGSKYLTINLKEQGLSKLFLTIARAVSQHSDTEILRQAIYILCSCSEDVDCAQEVLPLLARIKEDLEAEYESKYCGKVLDKPNTLAEYERTVMCISLLMQYSDSRTLVESRLENDSNNRQLGSIYEDLMINIYSDPEERFASQKKSQSVVVKIIELSVQTLKSYFLWQLLALPQSAEADPDKKWLEEMVKFQEKILPKRISASDYLGNNLSIKLQMVTSYIELSVACATLRANSANIGQDENVNGDLDEDADDIDTEEGMILASMGKVDATIETEILKVYDRLEREYCKINSIEVANDDDGEEENEDEEDDSRSETSQDKSSNNNNTTEDVGLLWEYRLCLLAGKMVLAINSQVIDVNRFKARLERNSKALGPVIGSIIDNIITE